MYVFMIILINNIQNICFVNILFEQYQMLWVYIIVMVYYIDGILCIVQ